MKGKYLIWMVIPSHYQSAFFDALRAKGADLQVCYYEKVHAARLKMGWKNLEELPPNEKFVPKELESLETVSDWRERIHVIPGCRERFLRQLAIKLSREGVSWVHWSEPSHPGIRRFLGWPIKRWYSGLINRYALGAIGIGRLAIEDFKAWGVRKEKIAMVPYSSTLFNSHIKEDKITKYFCIGKQPVFLFLGSLCKRKAVDILLKAFSEIQIKSGNQAVLILVGDDNSEGAYEQQVEILSIKDRVFFRGPVDPKELGGILKLCDVLCLPSRWDGWGVVLNEAASMGLALIASDHVGAAYHLIEPEQNGFRIKAGNVESLVQAMNIYVNEPSLAKKHGDCSLRIFNGYSAESNAQRFLQTVERWRTN